MTDEELQHVGITRFGDRIALRVFCKQASGHDNLSEEASGSSRQQTLVSRLKAKFDNKQLKPSYRGKALTGNKNAKKICRSLELGWLNFDYQVREYKQVRYRRGGGTRKVHMECTSTMHDLMKVARRLFFPDGVSVEGKEEDFTFGMGGFDSSVVDLHLTVEELYSRSQAKMLRVYLMSKAAEVDASECGNVDISSASPKKLLVLDSSTVPREADADTQHDELPDLEVRL